MCITFSDTNKVDLGPNCVSSALQRFTTLWVAAEWLPSFSNARWLLCSLPCGVCMTVRSMFSIS